MREALMSPLQRQQQHQQWQVLLLSPFNEDQLPLDGRPPKQRVQQQWEVQLHKSLPYRSAYGEEHYLILGDRPLVGASL
jgi:hypothetical protein